MYSKEKIKKKLSCLILPLLLGAAIMSSIIYDYQSADVKKLTALSVLFEVAVFLFLDMLYSMKYKKIAGLMCFISLIAALYVMGNLVRDGYMQSHIMFNRWFYYPVDNVDLYLYALIFGGGYLFYAALFYFTQVRYRGMFTLLLVIFPFAIYAKRLDTMPASYLFVILFLYLLVMVHSRQTAADSGIVVVPNASYVVSILTFAAAAVGVLFLIPKPDIQSVQEKDASVFDDLSLFGNGAPELIADMLNRSSRDHGILPTGQELFYVNTSEDMLYMKLQSYSYFENNNWHYGDDKIEGADYVWTYPAHTVQGMAITNKLSVLEEYCKYTEDEQTLALIEDMRQRLQLSGIIVIAQEDYRFKYLPLPEGIVSTGVGAFHTAFPSEDRTYESQEGNIYCNGEWEVRNPIMQYSANYYSNDLIREFASRLDLTTEKWDEIMDWYYIHGSDYGIYDDANSDRSHAQLVDSGEYDEYDDRIRQLALEITEGCETDYEKALALESYFTKEGYIYDLEYIPDDESIEYFIFESKTGICTDFATAMTLMARSVGLNARYCEGYVAYENASYEQVRNNNISSGISLSLPQGWQGFGDRWYLVRDNYAHAFVEIYLPACGWVVFEPTVPSFTDIMMYIPTGGGFSIIGVIGQVWFYVGIGAIAVALIILIILFRRIIEAVFRIYVTHIDRERALKKLYARILKRISKKSDTDLSAYTVSQACAFASGFGIDITELGTLFEYSFYGGRKTEGTDFERAYEQYKQAYKAKIKAAAYSERPQPV